MFRKKVKNGIYDRENMKPVIKASICTGEQVAGFKDVHTGKRGNQMRPDVCRCRPAWCAGSRDRQPWKFERK